MAALRVDRLPEGPEWLYEIKLDGYRAFRAVGWAKIPEREAARNLPGFALEP